MSWLIKHLRKKGLIWNRTDPFSLLRCYFWFDYVVLKSYSRIYSLAFWECGKVLSFDNIIVYLIRGSIFFLPRKGRGDLSYRVLEITHKGHVFNFKVDRLKERFALSFCVYVKSVFCKRNLTILFVNMLLNMIKSNRI